MALRKVKLGRYIEQCCGGNENNEFGASEVRGISVDKQFISTKAKLDGVPLKNYVVVNPKCFAFVLVTSRNGGKISIAYNSGSSAILVSNFNSAFRLNSVGKKLLLEEYLYMVFNRPEFDRYARMNSWGSARERFYFSDLCDVEIELPPIEVQRKYVAVYESMLENQQSYERGLEDLKLTCDGYIEKLMRECRHERIAPYIVESDSRNDGSFGLASVRGISTNKEFISTKAKMDGVSLTNYKAVMPGMIAYVADTSRRGDKISLALNEGSQPYLVSSISQVFKADATRLLPEYLILFFSRSEFDRYARFNSWGSARETFTWKDLQDVEIPVPDIKTQRAIADIYKVYRQRNEINERLKTQLRDICPVLIKGSIDEARVS